MSDSVHTHGGPHAADPVATSLSVGLSVDGQTVFAVAETAGYGRRAALLTRSTLQRLLDHAGDVLRGLPADPTDRPVPADRLPADRIGEAAGNTGQRFAHYADWEDAPSFTVNEVALDPRDGYLVIAFSGRRQTFGSGAPSGDEPAFRMTLDRPTAYRVLAMMGKRARSAGLVSETAAAWLFHMDAAAPTWVH